MSASVSASGASKRNGEANGGEKSEMKKKKKSPSAKKRRIYQWLTSAYSKSVSIMKSVNNG